MAKGYSSITPKGEIAKQYVIENPKLASRTLARMLKHDHPELFKSIEDARGTVRSYRGNKGEQCREGMKQNRDTFRPNGKAGEVNLPAGRNTFKPPLQISGDRKILVIADCHVPYHDERALEAAIRHGVKEGCEAVYLNGDVCDFYALSRFQKDRAERNLKREIDTTKEVLTEFARHFPERWFKQGNHDERWDNFLNQGEEGLSEFTEFQLETVLKLKETGYTHILSKQWAEMNGLSVIHGHEFQAGISAPVNPARGLWLKVSETAMCGHLHKSSYHPTKLSLSGSLVACWSLGCTCYLHPKYAVLNGWTQGWAIVELSGKKKFQVSNYQFHDGEVYRG